jgi:adenylate cyclase
VLNYYMFYKHYDMPFLSVVLALAAAFIYVTVYKAVLEGREKKWIKNTFGQYLSPKVVEIITKDPSKLKLGGEKRDMTAMFCDIASFTTISEKLTPEQLTAMLNTYLSGLTDEILKHDGVVDKFIGDCIMAFWNAPLDLKNHRTQACLAAVDCLAVNNRLNDAAKDMVVKPNFRIGLNAGPMTVGNMGSQNRFSYTAIGDAVNLASRLEGANKFFHSRIMASEDVFMEAKDLLDSRYLGQIRVVGKAIPVKVYELFARKGEAAPEVVKMLKLYGAGMANFYAGKYQESAKDFKAALAARPEDGPSQFYIELAEKYIKEPPKEWDGTFNLESK